jgi:hypothetical protein
VFFTPIGRLKKDLEARRVETAATRAELDDVQARSSQTLARLDQATNRLTTSQYDLMVAEVRLHAVQQALAHKNGNLATATARLARARKEYERIHTELGASQTRLQVATRQLGVLNTQVHGLQYDSAALAAQRDDLDTQVKELRLVLSEFARVSFARLALNAGQEMLTGLMPAGDATTRRAWALGFLDTAEAVARQQCPKLAADAAAIAYIDSAGGGLRRLTREEATSMLLARAGRTGAGPLVLRLAPANNTPEDGPALVVVDTLDLSPDMPVYARGAAISTIDLTVTSATDRGEVLRAIMDDLLRRELPRDLRAGGLVSATRRYDPRRPGKAPEPMAPQVSWGEIMAAVDRATARPGRVQVRVIAVAATTRFGPPALALEVAPAP